MPNLLTVPVGARDHGRGAAVPSVVLVEYGDFECPQCGRARPILARLEASFSDRMRFVFRHFPLTNSHPNAQHAAEAAEWAASLQTFWRMHDALYADQRNLSDHRMLDIARGLGLPAEGLERAWVEHTYLPRVKQDFASGIASGVTGTPAFFINGVRHEGTWDEPSLTQALQAAGLAA